MALINWALAFLAACFWGGAVAWFVWPQLKQYWAEKRSGGKPGPW